MRTVDVASPLSTGPADAPSSIEDKVKTGVPVWWMIGVALPNGTVQSLAVTAISDQTSPAGLTAALGGGGILVVYATVRWGPTRHVRSAHVAVLPRY